MRVCVCSDQFSLSLSDGEHPQIIGEKERKATVSESMQNV